MRSSNSSILNNNGIALKGYDPVAFFTMNKAIRGSKRYMILRNDLEWRFVSEAHRQAFTRNPEKYIPKYGGFCAYGASEGYKATSSPEAFTIFDDKLYFNFANYVKRKWLEKRSAKIDQADANWSTIKYATTIKANPSLIFVKYKFLLLFGKNLFE
ncbi:MAG: YHS domain-containing (seleno)protein [Ekhidna sp.]|uniref:YHS domain-containing (seleno)protein n=1 Tax=Ekhidna sp. TaxID=2608089 RepID=UPI0032ECE3F0